MNEKEIREELNRLLKGRKDRREVIMQTQHGACRLVDFILQHFKEQKEVVFVEIGVHMGGSFVLIGNCLLQAGKTVVAIGIDIFNMTYDKHTTLPPDQAVAALNPQFLWGIIEGDSHEKKTLNKLKDDLQGRGIDLLFIDGDHSVEGCLEDYTMYRPLVRKGGLIVFDDVNNKPKKAWEKIRKRCKHTTGFHGFGVVYVGG
jgi:cephalosporin hydroxylase